MRDNDYERPKEDDSEEIPVFSDQELEDYLELKVEPSEGEETLAEADPPPQTLASLKRQRRSKRSLMFIAVLCLGLGILVLAVFFLMRPEVRKPQMVAKRMKRPIPSVESEEGPTIPGAGEKKAGEEALSEGGIPEEGEPSGAKLPETPLLSHEREAERKVLIIEGTELSKGEQEDKVIEPVAKKPEIEGKAEPKPQVAKIEEPKARAIPQGKLPVGRFTVNVGSFRMRARAERLMKELEEKGYDAFVAKAAIPKKGTWYRVSVGRFPSREEARSFGRTLKEKEGMNSFVRELTEGKR